MKGRQNKRVIIGFRRWRVPLTIKGSFDKNNPNRGVVRQNPLLRGQFYLPGSGIKGRFAKNNPGARSPEEKQLFGSQEGRGVLIFRDIPLSMNPEPVEKSRGSWDGELIIDEVIYSTKPEGHEDEIRTVIQDFFKRFGTHKKSVFIKRGEIIIERRNVADFAACARDLKIGDTISHDRS